APPPPTPGAPRHPPGAPGPRAPPRPAPPGVPGPPGPDTESQATSTAAKKTSAGSARTNRPTGAERDVGHSCIPCAYLLTGRTRWTATCDRLPPRRTSRTCYPRARTPREPGPPPTDVGPAA